MGTRTLEPGDRSTLWVSILLGAALLTWTPVAVAQERDDETDWVIEAELALKKGRDRKALLCVEKALSVDASDIEALVLGIEVARNLGEQEKLDSWSAAWLKLAPTDRRAAIFRAEVLADRGATAEALALLTPLAARRTPEPESTSAFDFEAVAALASLHSDSGDVAKAEALYEGLVAESKRVVLKEVSDLFGLVQVYVHFGGREGLRLAEKELAKEIQPKVKADPTVLHRGYRAWLLLARLYRTRFYLPGDADAELKELHELRPNLADAWAEQAMVLKEWRRQEPSDAARETCLRINPKHPQALALKAASALGDFEIESAAAAIETILAAKPRDPDGLALRAVHMRLSGGAEKAAKALADVRARSPKSARVHLLIAQVLDERRRWPECLEEARAAVKLEPENPAAQDALAKFAFFLGLEEEGFAAIRAADDVDVFIHPWRKNYFTVKSDLKENYVDAISEKFLHRVHKIERDVLAPYLLPFCEQSFAELTKKYEFVPEGVPTHPGKVLVETFRDHAGFSARTLGFGGLGATGVCFGNLIIQDSPAALPLGQNSWARTFHHELAHTMTLGLSKGRTPRWLTEGLSTYEEYCKDPSWVRPLERELFDALANDDLLKVLHFDAAFSTARIIFAYYQGGIASQWMAETYGMPKILDFLRAFGEDLGARAALDRAFGLTPELFDSKFKDYVKARLKDVKLRPKWNKANSDGFEARISKDPKDVEALILLAEVRFQQGSLLDAQDLLSKGMTLGMKDARADRLLGLLARKDKRSDVAKRHLGASLEAGLEDFDTRIALAQMAEKDAPEAAIQHYRKAIECFSRATGKDSPRLALARLLRGEGNVDQVIELFEEHLKVEFESIPVRKEIVGIAKSRGDKPRLKRHLEAWLLIDPFNLEVLRDLGGIHFEEGSIKLAEREFSAGLGAWQMQPAAKRDPGAGADLHVLLARAIQKSPGREEDAMESVERALSLVPEHAAAKKLQMELRAATPGGGDNR